MDVKKDRFNPEKIDLGKILIKYKQHWWWFAISLFICIGLSVCFLSIKRPSFDVTAKVLVSTEEGGGGMGMSMMKNLSFMGEGTQIDDEIEIIGSHSALIQAIKNLSLYKIYSEKTGIVKSKKFYNNSPVEITAPDQLFDTLSVALDFKIKINETGEIDIKAKEGMFNTLAVVNSKSFPILVKTEYGIFSVNKTVFFKKDKPYNISAKLLPHNVLAEDLSEKISTYSPTKKSNSIVITTESADVDLTKDLLNQMISLYNIRGVTTKNEIAERTKEFINERLVILYTELSKSELNIESYKKTNNFVDLTAEAGYQLTKKGALENSLLKTETDYTILKMIQEFLNNPKNNYSLIPFSTDNTQGVTEYNRLILEYLKLKNDAKDNNIVVKTVVEQIDAMRSNVAKSISTSIQSLSITLDDLKKNSNNTNSKLGNIPKQEREFINLQRAQTIQNYLYSYLLQKREENELVLAAAIPKGQIIDVAYCSSEPVSPNKFLVIALSLFLGILFPILIMYIQDLFKTKFYNIDELSNLTNIPTLGEICHSQKESKIVVSKNKTTPIVELFRLIRNNIQFMLSSKSNNVILVTSTISGEGKSFVSMNIAASLSLLDHKKTIIVGMDIRSPQIKNYLNMDCSIGLTNYLSDSSVSLNEIIHHYDEAKLDVIIAGPIPPNPSELLLTDRVTSLITALQAKYDYIILDSAPVGMVSDTFSLAKYADLTIYVTRAGYTKKSAIKYLNATVENNQLRNVAIVLNDTNSKLSSGYGYGYGDKNDD